MAEFSQEYQTATGSSFPGDFSIMEEFKHLIEGMTIELVCEGFGSHSIRNIDGKCYLLYFNREPVLIENAIKEIKNN